MMLLALTLFATVEAAITHTSHNIVDHRLLAELSPSRGGVRPAEYFVEIRDQEEVTERSVREEATERSGREREEVTERNEEERGEVADGGVTEGNEEGDREEVTERIREEGGRLVVRKVARPANWGYKEQEVQNSDVEEVNEEEEDDGENEALEEEEGREEEEGKERAEDRNDDVNYVVRAGYRVEDKPFRGGLSFDLITTPQTNVEDIRFTTTRPITYASVVYNPDGKNSNSEFSGSFYDHPSKEPTTPRYQSVQTPLQSIRYQATPQQQFVHAYNQYNPFYAQHGPPFDTPPSKPAPFQPQGTQVQKPYVHHRPTTFRPLPKVVKHTHHGHHGNENQIRGIAYTSELPIDANTGRPVHKARKLAHPFRVQDQQNRPSLKHPQQPGASRQIDGPANLHLRQPQRFHQDENKKFEYPVDIEGSRPPKPFDLPAKSSAPRPFETQEAGTSDGDEIYSQVLANIEAVFGNRIQGHSEVNQRQDSLFPTPIIPVDYQSSLRPAFEEHSYENLKRQEEGNEELEEEGDHEDITEDEEDSDGDYDTRKEKTTEANGRYLAGKTARKTGEDFHKGKGNREQGKDYQKEKERNYVGGGYQIGKGGRNEKEGYPKQKERILKGKESSYAGGGYLTVKGDRNQEEGYPKQKERTLQGKGSRNGEDDNQAYLSLLLNRYVEKEKEGKGRRVVKEIMADNLAMASETQLRSL